MKCHIQNCFSLILFPARTIAVLLTLASKEGLQMMGLLQWSKSLGSPFIHVWGPLSSEMLTHLLQARAWVRISRTWKLQGGNFWTPPHLIPLHIVPGNTHQVLEMLPFHPTITSDRAELLACWAKNGKNTGCTITPQHEHKGQVSLGRTCQNFASSAMCWKFYALSCQCRIKMGCFREMWITSSLHCF